MSVTMLERGSGQAALPASSAYTADGPSALWRSTSLAQQLLQPGWLQLQPQALCLSTHSVVLVPAALESVGNSEKMQPLPKTC